MRGDFLFGSSRPRGFGRSFEQDSEIHEPHIGFSEKTKDIHPK